MTDQPDHAGPLARLLAKDAISDAILRFARGADRSDLELMRSAYWPDATDDHGNFYACHEHLPEPHGGPVMVTLVGGRYIDRFEERNGEWRILARVVTMDWSEHRPAAALGAETLAQFSKSA